jgi:hypothetical protein
VAIQKGLLPLKFHSTPTNTFPQILSKGGAEILPKLRISMPRTRYFAGETVRGCVVLNIRGNATRLENFSIMAKGSHDTKSFYTYRCGSHTCVAVVNEEHTFFQKHSVLERDNMVLQPGQYCFEFAVRLSTNLPPSSNAVIGLVGSSINYSITCTMKEEGKKTRTCRADYALVGQVPAIALDLAPVTGRLVFKTSRKKDPVLVTLQLTSGATVSAGGFVPFNVAITNNTKKKIKKVSAYLKVTVSANAKGYYETTCRHSSEQDLRQEIGPKESGGGNYRIHIPEDYDYYNYEMPSHLGRAIVKAELSVRVSYGVASVTVSKDLQLVPDMKHLADVPPPLYYFRKDDSVLDAEFIQDTPPWYFYV